MATWCTSAKLWGDGGVPYEAHDGWVDQMIAEFNQIVGRTLFVLRTGELDYALFQTSEHFNSPMGMQGGQQRVDYKANDRTTLFHEMCHCLGFGHENFNTGWPYSSALLDQSNEDFHAVIYRQTSSKYKNFTAYDDKSIMLYSPQALGVKVGSADAAFQQNETLSRLDITAISARYAHVH